MNSKGQRKTLAGKRCAPCSLFKVFACIRKCSKWPESQGTPQPGLPVLARGHNTMDATKHMLICCIAPRLALQKRHLPYCKCLPNSRPFLFRVPCSVFRVPCSVFRAWCFAATAFAKQGTRCDDFEQALGRRFARLRTCMAACATASTNRPSTTHSATSSTAHPTAHPMTAFNNTFNGTPSCATSRCGFSAVPCGYWGYLAQPPSICQPLPEAACTGLCLLALFLQDFTTNHTFSAHQNMKRYQ